LKTRLWVGHVDRVMPGAESDAKGAEKIGVQHLGCKGVLHVRPPVLRPSILSTREARPAHAARPVGIEIVDEDLCCSPYRI
jgi:hypothetical protein